MMDDSDFIPLGPQVQSSILGSNDISKSLIPIFISKLFISIISSPIIMSYLLLITIILPTLILPSITIWVKLSTSVIGLLIMSGFSLKGME